MFEVFVADNFNYMDEEATHRLGEFASWAQALSVARAIVDRSLQEVHRPGVGALALFDAYKSFGEDPFINPIPEGERFSAWEYAKEKAALLCEESSNHKSCSSSVSSPSLPASMSVSRTRSASRRAL